MQATDIYSKVMAPLFDEKKIIAPSTVYQNFFNSPNGVTIYAPSSTQINIDIIRGNEKTAKLKVRGLNSIPTGPTQTTQLHQRYTNIARLFPLVEQDGYLTPDQFNERIAGEMPFQPLTPKQRALILASQLHAESTRRIVRKQEVLAAQAWNTGLQNVNEAGSLQLDYLRDTGLTSAVGTVWTDVAADAAADLLVACKALRAIGRATAEGILMNNDPFLGMIQQTKIVALANSRRMSFVALGMETGPMPAWGQKIIDGGGQYQGWIKIGAWTLHIFTYIDSYETDADVQTFYTPQTEVYVFAPNARWDRYFGPGEMTQDAIDEQVYREVFGISKAAAISQGLENVKNQAMFDARQFTLGAEKNGTRGYRVITQTAPMYVPTQTDTIYVLTGATT